MTAGLVGLDSLSAVDDTLYWLESRPLEQGRVALVQWRDGVSRELTPAPFNVRSRVHEYGGGAYLATPSAVFFVDFVTQDVHRIDTRDGSIRRITTAPDVRFADMAHDPTRDRLYAVAERPGGREPENLLVSIDLVGGSYSALHRGHDFYAAPRLSPDASRLAFVSWDHPNMPWDGSQLHVADVDPGGLTNVTVVAGGAEESVVEPRWLDDRRLVFTSDRSGYWNLCIYDESGISDVHRDSAEYAVPHWTFSPRSWAPLSSRHLVCRRIVDGEQSLVIVDTEQGFASPLSSELQTFDSLTSFLGGVALLGGAADAPAAVFRVDPATGRHEALHRPADFSALAPWFTGPEPVTYPTRDGERAHGYFYAPHNPDFVAAAGTAPPLVVMTHGGPTAAASPALNLRVQYYTSRGWAVLDVNYRGSTGFGRAYRRRLDGQWGVVDVTDCEDGVRFLVREGRVDRERVAIRGGSAGGFTTLAALTFGSTFRAGASWYGIGDLELLASDTHKFESRYTDRLVGPYPEAAARYRERSPIHHVDRLQSAVIFLQGLEDRVVPPNQAETMVAALRRKRLPVAYLTFPGEGHGFRAAAAIRRAVDAEYLFFARVFGFEPAEALPDIQIENPC
jgi:dipeptidyl aminopeptidase/acylaminoacyl peptidase